MASPCPDDFKCPISLELMSDPVILPSGHTFDRPSIQRWLDSGNRSCPITKLPLSENPRLIPNHALRSLIYNYNLFSSQTPAIKPEKQPRHLISVLSSASSPASSQLDALSHLTRLTKINPGIRRQLTESGALSSVLNFVSSDDSVMQERALSLLLNLSLDDDTKVGLVAEGAIERIITILRSGSANSRAIGCTILTSLAVVEVNKATIGAHPDAIEILVTLLVRGLGREVKEASTTLYAICLFPDNRLRAVDCGAVQILVKIGTERAVEVLSLLVKCEKGRTKMARTDGCVGALVKVIDSGSKRGVLSAIFTLNCLCRHSEATSEEARKQRVFQRCLRLMEDENEEVKSNASSLVQILSRKHSSR